MGVETQTTIIIIQTQRSLVPEKSILDLENFYHIMKSFLSMEKRKETVHSVSEMKLTLFIVRSMISTVTKHVVRESFVQTQKISALRPIKGHLRISTLG